jgi:S-adenosylmethionine synthetase
MTDYSYVFTSESVSEGHPDKVCDQIADVVLDAALAEDSGSRVACEVLCKDHHVVLAGEITSRADLDLPSLVRETVRRIGYVDPDQPFHPNRLDIRQFISTQAGEIARGVSGRGRSEGGVSAPSSLLEQGAGDQGIMFGFATDETPELMPLPILLAHRLTRTLADHRRRGTAAWLRPDAKAQVSVRYRNGGPVEVTTALVSTQHAAGTGLAEVESFVRDTVLPEALGRWNRPGLRLLVNPAGTFVQGGPSADAGVTGRKIIVDTYGGMARHGGGAFSGKDASKVDRSGAYFGRWVARQVVERGLAKKAEIQVSYAIGEPDPISVHVETFDTGDPRRAAEFVREFDFRPGAIVERLGLLRPIYRETTNYGHFGRPGLPWEEPGD